MTADSNNVPVPPKLDFTKEGILKSGGATQPSEEKKTVVPPIVPRAEPVRSSSAEIKIKPPESLERSQTMHISIPETEEKSAQQPPASVQSPSLAEIPRAPTIRAEPVTPAMQTETGPEAQTKRKTSRISLESALTTPTPSRAPSQPSTTPGVTPPKTIRIKPVPASGTIKSVGGVVITPTSSPPQTPTGEKRKTSRISLESAVAQEKVGTEPQKPASIPKTIQLKRPPTGTPVSAAATPMASAQVESPSEEGTPTKRKTIKVRRPGEQITLPTGAVHVTAAAADASAAAVPIPAPADRPSWIWHVITIAAILVIGVTIYVLASQAFGPNVSLTELSCWKDGPNLPWPGKIPPPTQ